jgi:hypothetical protein
MSKQLTRTNNLSGKQKTKGNLFSKTDLSFDSKSPVSQILNLQRRAGNQAVQNLFKSGAIQPKLKIGQPGDKYELEADRIAEQVMRMPDSVCPSCLEKEEVVNRKIIQRESLPSGEASFVQRQVGEEERRKREEEEIIQPKLISSQITPLVQRQAEDTEKKKREEEEGMLQTKEKGSSTSEVTCGIESGINSLRGGGQPLSESVRNYFEPRFGYNFSGVRVHTGNRAAEIAGKINAHAFTRGHDIAFGQDKYRPGTPDGQRLLAHELAHIIQQGAGHSAGIIQRTEVDDRSCDGLADIESDIDSKVNYEIAAARTATLPSRWPPTIGLFLREVSNRLGAGIHSPMEVYIINLPASKRRFPPDDLAGTKYSGVSKTVHTPFGDREIYSLQGVAPVVTAAARIHNICVGADKLGHFFQEGYGYFMIQSSLLSTEAHAESTGRALEIGMQGLSLTGVYSNADLAANRAGMKFYKDLEADPAMKFNIKSYITDEWNEQSNPSFYTSEVGRGVWRNLLTGQWEGIFMPEGILREPLTVKVDIAATLSSATGTYEWQIASAKLGKGKIKNGVIVQKTTTVSGTVPGEEPESATPVSGVSIEFDWEEDTSSGRGKWESIKEQTLSGKTWSIGSSKTNSGDWILWKVLGH